MTAPEAKFDAWGVVELFGHQRVAGRITEQTVGGCHFVRVDIPDDSEAGCYTRLFGQGAIYGMTFTSEEVARKAAASFVSKPSFAVELEWERKRLTEPRSGFSAAGNYCVPEDPDEEDPLA